MLLALLAGAYLAAGKLGLSLAIVHPNASPVWAPTGIALAAMLSFGVGVWPAIFLGAFLVNVTTAGTVATSLGIAAGNALEAVAGAWLVGRFANGPRAFDRAADTFKFAILAGMLSTTVSASFGVTSLALGGVARWEDYAPIWLTWWLGDLGGCLVMAPLLILWNRGRWQRWTRAHALEGIAMLACLVAVGQVVFGGLLAGQPHASSLKFLCMPPLIWAAFRFDQRVASAAILVLSSIAVWGTLGAVGAAGSPGLNESLVMLQVFLGVVAVTTLGLAALVAEQRRREEALRVASGRLREAMEELQAFSHSISHDLRSPIGAVLNYATIAEQEGARLGPEGLQLLRRIRTSAEGAAQLLDQLVRFVWVEREEEDQRNVDMTSLAREAFAELAAGSENPGEVRFEVSRLPAARGNRQMLLRVFRNLLSNSVKYTRGRESRRIEVAAVAGERENTYIVADNGIGFEPQQGGTLFQPFRRLGEQDSEGSGLGLAIVARIVRRHGGRVWAESDGVSGARFCFTLPSDGNGHSG